jgi:hypothetical protein
MRPPFRRAVICCSGRTDRSTAGEAIHLPFVLPVEGGKIGLYGPEATGKPIVDTLSYRTEDVAHDISLGRMDFGWGHRGFLVPMNEPTPGEANRLASLTLIESHTLDVSDPSGLGVDHTGRYFWTSATIPVGASTKSIWRALLWMSCVCAATIWRALHSIRATGLCTWWRSGCGRSCSLTRWAMKLHDIRWMWRCVIRTTAWKASPSIPSRTASSL